MADLTAPLAADPKPGRKPTARRAGGEPIWDMIELLFFAYRDFVGDPDDVLAKFGFGRAHHRVLHFVNRNPGMKVAELLDILKITKQSLGRVLKQLIDQGYVVQKEGANDRRQRLLYVTAKGEALAMKLAGLQTARIARALAELGPSAHEAARRFLVAMIDAEQPRRRAALHRAGRPRTAAALLKGGPMRATKLDSAILAGSPMPPCTSWLGTMCTSTSGISLAVSIGKPSKLSCCTRPRSEGDLSVQQRPEGERDGPFHLRLDGVRVHDRPGVDGAHHPVHARLVRRRSPRLRRPPPRSSRSSRGTRGPRMRPAGGGVPQPAFSAARSSTCRRPRARGQQSLAELERIGARRGRDLVDEAFVRERVLGVVDRAPPTHRDGGVGHHVVHAQIGDAVGEVAPRRPRRRLVLLLTDRAVP